MLHKKLSLFVAFCTLSIDSSHPRGTMRPVTLYRRTNRVQSWTNRVQRQKNEFFCSGAGSPSGRRMAEGHYLIALNFMPTVCEVT